MNPLFFAMKVSAKTKLSPVLCTHSMTMCESRDQSVLLFTLPRPSCYCCHCWQYCSHIVLLSLLGWFLGKHQTFTETSHCFKRRTALTIDITCYILCLYEKSAISEPCSSVMISIIFGRIMELYITHTIFSPKKTFQIRTLMWNATNYLECSVWPCQILRLP